MSLTITSRQDHSQGDLRGVSAIATFDSSYLIGGESLTPGDLGLGSFVGPIEITQGEDGFEFEWDDVNQKIVVRSTAKAALTPTLIVEEVVTMTTDTGTLAHPPAYIVAIEDPTAGVVYRTVPTGKTAVDNVSVAVNFTTGVIDNAAADGPATLKVTYFPQRPGTFFSLANLVIDEEVTALVAGVNTAFRAGVVQHIYNSSTDVALTEATPGDACGDGEIGLDINNSSATTIVTHVDEDADTLLVTYLKHSGLGKAVTFIDDTEIVLVSEAYDFVQDGSYGQSELIVPGYGTILVAEESDDTQAHAKWTGPTDVDANLIAPWYPKRNAFLTDNTVAVTDTEISWVNVDLPHSELSEVAEGEDLSAVRVQVFAKGTA